MCSCWYLKNSALIVALKLTSLQASLNCYIKLYSIKTSFSKLITNLKYAYIFVYSIWKELIIVLSTKFKILFKSLLVCANIYLVQQPPQLTNGIIKVVRK